MSIKIITPEAELYHRGFDNLFLEAVFLLTLPPFRSDTSINFFLGGGVESDRSAAYKGGRVWEMKLIFEGG
jgi:hypothetical protein